MSDTNPRQGLNGKKKEYDCIGKMGEWMVGNAIITLEELDQLTNDAKEYARAEKNEAWNQYSQPIKEMQKELGHSSKNR